MVRNDRARGHGSGAASASVTVDQSLREDLQRIPPGDSELPDRPVQVDIAVNHTPGSGALLILVPAYNEEACVGDVIREVREVLPGTPLLVVDDCSTDSTASIARQSGAGILRLPHHLGLGGGVQAGYKLAFELGYDYVVRIDADGQHDPHDIPRMLDMLRQTRVEMVIGSRFCNGEVPNGSMVRSAGIRFFRLVLRLILDKPVHDPTSGFVGVNRSALAVFTKSFPLEYPEIEALVVLQRKAFRFLEMPCRMRRRIAGRSTITPVRSLYYIVHVLLGVFVNILKYDGRRLRN